MEIDQLTVTPISLTFRMKAFLHESDDLMPLDTHSSIIVSLRGVTVTERHTLAYHRMDELSNVSTIHEYFSL